MKKVFFDTLMGLTPQRDCKPKIEDFSCIEVIISTRDETHSKFDQIYGAILPGVGEQIIFSFALGIAPGSKFFGGPKFLLY